MIKRFIDWIRGRQYGKRSNSFVAQFNEAQKGLLALSQEIAVNNAKKRAKAEKLVAEAEADDLIAAKNEQIAANIAKIIEV